MVSASRSLVVDANIREITDEEIAFYEENGWVKLDRLVSPELADELRRVVVDMPTQDRQRLAKNGVEPFRSLMFSEKMGQNAQRLANRRRFTDREIAMRYRTDLIASKSPGGAPTKYHQDSAEHGSDRVGEMQFWLALVDITPEMGAMRFLSGIHREGPLGSCFNKDAGDVLEQYPKLLDLYPLSAPLHYQPGDATVHHGYMLHGAPRNATERDRLAYLFSYVPADTRWWNGHTGNSGSERVLLRDEEYPVIAPRQEARR
jgi:hypothetical protein